MRGYFSQPLKSALQFNLPQLFQTVNSMEFWSWIYFTIHILIILAGNPFWHLCVAGVLFQLQQYTFNWKKNQPHSSRSVDSGINNDREAFFGVALRNYFLHLFKVGWSKVLPAAANWLLLRAVSWCFSSLSGAEFGWVHGNPICSCRKHRSPFYHFGGTKVHE